MVDAITPAINGIYGSAVSHAGPALTSEGKPSTAFAGGTYSAASLATTAPGSLLQPSPNLDVELLVETSGSTSKEMEPIISYGSASNGIAYRLDLTPRNTLKWTIAGGAPYFNWGYEGRLQVATGRPTHVVADFDGSSIHVFVNGVLDLTKHIVGPIDYQSIAQGKVGLVIGGSVGKNDNTFAGAIADVALYSRTLSAAEISSHFHAMSSSSPTPAPTVSPTTAPSATPVPSATPTGPSEMPKPASAFIDSVGVVAHFPYQDSPYFRMPNAYINLIENLHSRSVRGEGNGSALENGWFSSLCQRGVKHTLSFLVHATPELIKQRIALYGASCIDAVEPQNEYDAYSLNPAHPDPNWVDNIRSATRTLYNTVRSDPGNASITVLGPALSSISRYSMLGNLEAFSDAGNEHDGTCDGSPLTHHYKNIVDKLAFMKASYPTKPIWVGETNYANNPATSGCAVSKEVAAKYVPRMFLERFNLGQPRTFYNEVSDDAAEGAGWGTLGLTDTNAQPYPAYDALQSLLGVLPQERGGANLQPLAYAITGNASNVHHTLLQGNDGRYYMVLWLDLDSWDVKAKRPLNPPAQSITVSVPGNLHQASWYAPNGTFGMTESKSQINGSITLNVSDGPGVLALK